MSVKFRPELAQIPAYKAGKGPTLRTDDITAFKVSSNENPYPPLPKVQEVIAQAAQEVNRYPDPAAVTLRETIAAHYGMTMDRVAVATGAVALCYQFAHATAGPGDEVVYAWRSFEAYPILTAVVGATPVPVPLRPDGTHDLPAMLAAITARTRLIFICSPNNPTGAVVSQGELTEFLRTVPSEVMVVLDEAYIEFCRDDQASNGLTLLDEFDNIAVLRTFSKAYGLAGLRVGYALAAPDVIDALNKTALPFGVSGIAQAAATASLNDDTELKERVSALISERARVEEQFATHNVPFVPSQANFVWLPFGEQTQTFADLCEESGLTVRAFPDEGARVTVAEAQANDRLVSLAAQFQGNPIAP